MFKVIILAMVIWLDGSAGSYHMASRSACEALTAALVSYVQSADCASFTAFEPADDYFPPQI